MSKQPKALRIAAELLEPMPDFPKPTALEKDAADELRRLHAANLDVLLHFNTLKADYDALKASNAELLAALRECLPHFKQACLRMQTTYEWNDEPYQQATEGLKRAAVYEAAIANATKEHHDH